MKIYYRAHVENIGMTKTVSDGTTCGTVGKELRIEGIEMALPEDTKNLSIEYRVHEQDKGWTDWLPGGAFAGTEGEKRRIEAMEIRLWGPGADACDVYYRAHVQDIGWMTWAKNGGTAGTTGLFKRVEAFQIILADKGKVPALNPAAAFNKPFLTLPLLTLQAHVQGKGWTPERIGSPGSTVEAGTTGKNLRLESIRVTPDLADIAVSGEGHVENIGWMKTASGKDGIGTTGRNLRLEAIRLKLTGALGGLFDIWYCVHVQDIGWMGWAKNGKNAGTENGCKRIEAIRVKLQAAGQGAPGKTDGAFRHLEPPKPVPVPAPAPTPQKAPNLGEAIAIMLNLVNDDAHGYSQTNRWGPDFVCSSSIIWALQQAGFDTGGATYTGNMSAELCARGWVRLEPDCDPADGDICLNDANHVAMCVGDQTLAQFSIAETGDIDGEPGDQTGGEASVMPYYDYPWDCYLRYVG